jgi:hypothetical protein
LTFVITLKVQPKFLWATSLSPDGTNPTVLYKFVRESIKVMGRVPENSLPAKTAELHQPGKKTVL